MGLAAARRYVGLACVLRLEDGSPALGGCGTLMANMASGLVRAEEPSAQPEGDWFAAFERVAMPSSGGELRSRIGAAELVLPVR